MKKIIIANWKMNPESIVAARSLLVSSIKKVANSKKIDFLAAAPAAFLADPLFKKHSKRLAGQNIAWSQEGALTGEISGKMLQSLGVKYSIVGHSERRICFFENEETIVLKLHACFEAGLRPILCLGEDADIRCKGLALVKIYLKDQLRQLIAELEHSLLEQIIFVYEPIWTIGGKEADDPKDSAELIEYIKSNLKEFFGVKKPVVLYGGSVNENNIREILTQKAIDGVMVGGASIDAKEFSKIIKNANI